MSKRTTLEDRLQIVGLAEAGLTDPQIAEQIGWSKHTVRKWRRRGQRQGRAGLASTMGRPRRGALSEYPGKVRATLKRWREAHPGWGAKTLHAELLKDPAFTGQRTPSAASIGRFLREQNLTRSYEKHSAIAEPDHRPAEEPHEVWEMDARGYSRVPDVGVVSLVNLNDRCSHARLLSYPVWLGDKRCQRHADTEDYQTTLRLAFSDWGLPKQLQVDHESVFVDNRSKSPFPTRLHLWLVALGVELVFGRPARPTDQGMTERSHQLWAAQCLQGQRYADWDDLYLALHKRRDFLNCDLPCASLANQPPLVAFPEAVYSGRPYRPEWEADLLDLERVWDYLAPGRWFRKTSHVYTFSLGGQIYYCGKPWQQTQLEITFDPADRHLACLDEAGNLVSQQPIQGITVERLMGSLAAYANLPRFQLALPFEWADLRAARLLDTIPVRLIET
ncbi:MAG: transposase [bacterium]|nr:transposase [bacterium]